MKKNIIMMVSILLNVMLAISLCMHLNIPSKNSSIYGTYQCQEYPKDNGLMTFAFEENEFTLYDASFHKTGSYTKEHNTYTIMLEHTKYVLSLQNDAFVFPVEKDDTTFMCEFKKVGDIPMYQNFEK